MTNNKEQTAVDFAVDKLAAFIKGNDLAISLIKHQAKEMEKEQHRVTAEDFYYGNWEYKKFHDYYNETYGGGEQ